MRHYSTVKSPTEQSAPPLHPVLRDALAGLDIQLDEELTRYRRHKAGLGRVPRRSHTVRAPKSLDLIAVTPHATVPATAPTPTPSASSATQALPQSVQPRPSAAEVARAESANAATSLALVAQPERLDDEDGFLQTDAEHEPSLIMDDSSPDDYLESSEELLRSLADEEAAVEAEQGFMQNLLTPIGIGSMLLLLVSSAMFGYVAMNPSSLGGLFAKRDAPASPDAANPAASTPQTSGLAAPQPNLAEREFTQINPDSLATLKLKSAAGSPTAAPGAPPATLAKPATPAAKRSSAAGSTSLVGGTTPEAAPPAASSEAPVPVVPTIQAPRPAAPPVVSAPPRAAAPRPVAPAPVQRYSAPPPPAVAPAPAKTSAAPAEDYQYKVVTPYSGDRSLDEARQAIPDAYVRNFSSGAKVQVGAFKNQSEADAQVQELRQQGIEAEVYKP